MYCLGLPDMLMSKPDAAMKKRFGSINVIVKISKKEIESNKYENM